MAAVVTDTKSMGRQPRLGAWLLISPLFAWLALFVVAPVAIMVVYSFCTPKQPAGVAYSFSLAGYQDVFNVGLSKVVILSMFFGLGFTALMSTPALALAHSSFRFGDFWERHGNGVLLALMVASGWIAATVLCEMVENVAMVKVFVTSINYAIVSTLICVVLGYPVAYFMGRAPERWRNLLMLLIMIPFWTSFLIRTYAWVNILNTRGTLNDLLLGLNIISQPLDLMPSSTAVMIGLVYTYLPFMILPIYTSCERLDQSLIEASFDLGANPFKSFWSVILPLTWPGVVAGVVITFVPAIGMFAVNDILGGKREQLIGNVIANQFVGQGRNWPLGAALGMVLMGMFVVTYYLSTRKRGSIV